MKRNGFTFIELLLVVLCIAILVTGAGFSFKRAKTSHMSDTFVQELVILKTAIETYYETYGTLPNASGKLASFVELKNFWKPFNPDASNVFPDACWYGNISSNLDEVYLQLYRYATKDSAKPVVFSVAEVKALQKKMESICKFKKMEKLNSETYVCYIFQEPIIATTEQTPTKPSE